MPRLEQTAEQGRRRGRAHRATRSGEGEVADRAARGPTRAGAPYASIGVPGRRQLRDLCAIHDIGGRSGVHGGPTKVVARPHSPVSQWSQNTERRDRSEIKGGRKPNRGRRRGQPVGRWWRDDRHRWPRPFRSSSTISARTSFQVQRSARRPLADRSGSPPARRLSRHGSPPAETWRLGPPRGQSRARIHRPAAGCPSGPPRPRGGSAVRGCRCPSSG